MSEGKEKIKKNESEWDKKKIILFSIIAIALLIIGLMVSNLIPGAQFKKLSITSSVKGVNTQVSVKQNVQNQIQALKQEAGNINLVDIATSSPQVQKVINDLRALKDYPNNQIKQTCMDICQKL